MKVCKEKQPSLGFTLIELLVVISVIGMLATVIVVSLSSARGKARDAKRLSDIRQIMVAMEIYYNDHAAYPDQASAGANPTLTSTGGATTQWQSYLNPWLTAPTPAGGTCANGGASAITDSTNQYTYWGRNAGDTASVLQDPLFYQITFCTGTSVGGYPAGELKATPSGIFAN